MNREIKFKFWDHAEKRFINLCRVDENGKVREGNDYYDDVIILQYTGTKDKNGKEIYEGDILKIHWRIESLNLDHYFEAVKWDSFGNCWGPIGTLTIDSIENEVVGNIFENPEIQLL